MLLRHLWKRVFRIMLGLILKIFCCSRLAFPCMCVWCVNLSQLWMYISNMSSSYMYVRCLSVTYSDYIYNVCICHNTLYVYHEYVCFLSCVYFTNMYIYLTCISVIIICLSEVFIFHQLCKSVCSMYLSYLRMSIWGVYWW